MVHDSGGVNIYVNGTLGVGGMKKVNYLLEKEEDGNEVNLNKDGVTYKVVDTGVKVREEDTEDISVYESLVNLMAKKKDRERQ